MASHLYAIDSNEKFSGAMEEKLFISPQFLFLFLFTLNCRRVYVYDVQFECNPWPIYLYVEINII